MLIFVKECKGDELAPIGNMDGMWAALEKAWQAPGEVKGYRTHRTINGFHGKHRKLRKKAGREDTLQRGFVNGWSAAEEEALLSFVKELKGDEMADMSYIAFTDIEKAWQALGKAKGFSAPRTAKRCITNTLDLRKKRAKQSVTTPQPSTTSTMGPAPSVRSSGRKRTLTTAFLAISPSSTSAKRAKTSPSPSASVTLSPPPLAVSVKTEAPDSDDDAGSTLDDDDITRVKVEVKGGLTG